MSKPWREMLKVHPAAQMFPPLSKDELRELADDIKKNGLRQRVALRFGKKGDVLLDGCSRLDALELNGEELFDPKGKLRERLGTAVTMEGRDAAVDEAYALQYVISANIRRRHLTAEEKRELIAKLLKAAPEKSDRQIAAMVKTSHHTVAAVRVKAERRGQIAHVAVRRDTKGRRQPAAKPARKPVPVSNPLPAAPAVSRGVLMRPAGPSTPEPNATPQAEFAQVEVDDPVIRPVEDELAKTAPLVEFLCTRLGGDLPQLIALLDAFVAANGNVRYLIGELDAAPRRQTKDAGGGVAIDIETGGTEATSSMKPDIEDDYADFLAAIRAAHERVQNGSRSGDGMVMQGEDLDGTAEGRAEWVAAVLEIAEAVDVVSAEIGIGETFVKWARKSRLRILQHVSPRQMLLEMGADLPAARHFLEAAPLMDWEAITSGWQRRRSAVGRDIPQKAG